MSTLMQSWTRHWRERPEALALIGPDRSMSASELAEASARCAAALNGHGIGRGDRVLMSCSPSVDLVVTYIALMRLGATVVPANTTYTARELAHIVNDAKPVAAVADPSAVGTLIGLGVGVVVMPGDVCADKRAVLAGELDAAEPHDPALIAYTSGTTGVPKGAVLTHANVLAGVEALRVAWEWTPDDVLVLALPLFHMHGLGVGVNGSLHAGAAMVVVPQFSADAVFDAIGRHEATMFFGVPTMYARLAESDRLPELATLRLAVSGSAPLPPTLWQTVRDRGGQEVLERYGMTETVMLTSNALHGARKPGSVGQPLPGVEVRLGEGGVVEVRGANIFTGYLDRPDATADAFTEDGFFRTGDIGEFDDDGNLFLVGRASELIITGGYNVYPREVEDVIRGDGHVHDVAVVGAPDEVWGEVVTAFVVVDEMFDEATVAQRCSENLASYKVPRHWQRIDAMPRNAMGKVVRADLVARAQRA